MEKEKKKSKKKILLYYLILAACLLVIAAVTVTVIFAVRNNNDVTTIDGSDGPDNTQQDGNGDGTGNNNTDGTGNVNDGNDNEKDDNTPTATAYEFILPVQSVVSTAYEFAYDVTLDRYCVHQGMDFEGTAGDNVCAVLDGTVVDIVTDHKLGENYIELSHANGITTTYKYVDVNENLSVGDTVNRGEVIGTIAQATGMEMKQGDHLHFEINVNGKAADPALYLDLDEK